MPSPLAAQRLLQGLQSGDREERVKGHPPPLQRRCHSSMHGTHRCEGRAVVPRQARRAEPAVRGPCGDAGAGVSLEAGAHDADQSCRCCCRGTSRPSRRQRQRYHLLGGPPRPHAVRPVCDGPVPAPCSPGRAICEAPSEHLVEDEAGRPHVAGRRVGVPVLLVTARKLGRAPQIRAPRHRHGEVRARRGAGAVVVDELKAAARARRVKEEIVAPALKEETGVGDTE